MTSTPKYRVVLSGTVLPEKSRAAVVRALADLFHAEIATGERLLQGQPVTLVKEYTRDQAEKICAAIRRAGARCELAAVAAVAPPTDSPEQDAAPPPATEQAAPEADTPHGDHESTDNGGSRADSPGESGRESRLPVWAHYVRVNTEYYGRRFAKFGGFDGASPAFVPTWNWAAFFVFYFWALYRKLWTIALFYLIGSLVLWLWVDPGVTYLLWAGFWGSAANYLYYRRIRSLAASGERTETLRGVSMTAVLFGGVVMICLQLILGDLIRDRFIQRYLDDFGGVASFEPLWRGDGSRLPMDDAATDPEVANTAVRINLIAILLKTAAAASPPQGLETLTHWQEVMRDKGVEDAWGTGIALRQYGDQAALVSAGPDRQFDSGDDILQYLPLNTL